MTDKIILAGNWKMNLGIKDSVDLAASLAELAAKVTQSEIWVAPSAMALEQVAEAGADTPLECGSQNVHWEEKGAFTGELSLPMIKEAGCTFAIVGHSERRHVFGESDEMITNRALATLKSGMTCVFCIGETLEEREAGKTCEVNQRQLAGLIAGLTPELEKSLVIAYEPVWAIGTGKVATVDEVDQTHTAIAAYYEDKMGTKCPAILYGGSVKSSNFEEIINVPLVSGCLIGGAALKLDEMTSMAEQAEKL